MRVQFEEFQEALQQYLQVWNENKPTYVLDKSFSPEAVKRLYQIYLQDPSWDIAEDSAMDVAVYLVDVWVELDKKSWTQLSKEAAETGEPIWTDFETTPAGVRTFAADKGWLYKAGKNFLLNGEEFEKWFDEMEIDHSFASGCDFRTDI